MMKTIIAPPETDVPVDWALHYVRLGWHVFPVWPMQTARCGCGKATCRDAGKHPIGRLAPHGRDSASDDPETIRGWWDAEPDANVGIATGAVSKLAVIDIDPPRPDQPVDGEDSLAELQQLLGALPETVQHITGRGGRHLLFRHPGGELASRNAVNGALGVDLKSDGGYIVAPPSLHASGRRYCAEWSSRPGEVDLAALPETWERWLRGTSSFNGNGTGSGLRERAPGTPDWPTLWAIVKRANLEDAHRQGRRIRARCPNPLHPDHNPSFDLYTNAKGVPDWRCRTGTGCTVDVLRRALGWETWRDFWVDFPTASDEPPPPADDDAPPAEPVIIPDIGGSKPDGSGESKPASEPFVGAWLTATELLAAEPLDRFPVIGGGILDCGCYGIVAGPDGTAKSLAMLHLDVALASDHPWFGLQTHGPVSTAYILTDDDRDTPRERLRAILRREKCADDPGVSDRIHILARPWPWGASLDLLDPGIMRHLIGYLRDHDIRKLTIDHLAGVHRLSALDLLPLINALDQIATEAGCAVIGMAHPSKAGNRASKNSPAADDIWGDSRLRNMARLRIRMAKLQRGRYRLRFEKVNRGAEPDDIHLHHPDQDDPSLATCAAPDATRERSDRVAQIATILKEHPNGLTAHELGKKIGVAHTSVLKYAKAPDWPSEIQELPGKGTVPTRFRLR